MSVRWRWVWTRRRPWRLVSIGRGWKPARGGRAAELAFCAGQGPAASRWTSCGPIFAGGSWRQLLELAHRDQKVDNADPEL